MFVLEGGIKGWIAGGAQFRELVDGFEEGYWVQFAEVREALEREKEEGKDGAGEGGGGSGNPHHEMLPPNMKFL